MITKPCVFIIEDDEAVCNHLRLILEAADLYCQAFESAEQFLASDVNDMLGCLLLDVCLPGLNGEELQAELNRRNLRLPIIFMTAYGDIPMTVRTMKAGAVDFLAKPIQADTLIERVRSLLQLEVDHYALLTSSQDFRNRLAKLTSRERQILPLALAGISNKDIAKQLDISYRTIEVHRIRILHKMGVHNFLEVSSLCDVYRIDPNSLS